MPKAEHKKEQQQHAGEEMAPPAAGTREASLDGRAAASQPTLRLSKALYKQELKRYQFER
jgi:hypothetical protein